MKKNFIFQLSNPNFIDSDFCYHNCNKINVERLVGLTFMIGNEDKHDFKVLSKLKIKQIDGNKANNNINNLHW